MMLAGVGICAGVFSPFSAFFLSFSLSLSLPLSLVLFKHVLFKHQGLCLFVKQAFRSSLNQTRMWSLIEWTFWWVELFFHPPRCMCVTFPPYPRPWNCLTALLSVICWRVNRVLLLVALGAHSQESVHMCLGIGHAAHVHRALSNSHACARARFHGAWFTFMITAAPLIKVTALWGSPQNPS